MADEEKEPKPTAKPKPKPIERVSRQLLQLHRLIGEIITLEETHKVKGLLIDGDLEVVYSAELKGKIKDRVRQKLAVAAGLIQELQNDG